jgi:hypothetical protein
MTEITDAEVAQIQWASSEQGKAAVRAAWEKAQQLGLDVRPPSTPAAAMAYISAVVYAAYLAAGWDGEPGGQREHAHDWKVLKSEEVSNPSSGPSAFGWQTVALLRCAGCGDVASRILAGRWDETLKAAGTGLAPGEPC